MENFVACLRLSRSLILSCICPLPFLSISFNSVKRDSFLLWLPFSVHFCVGGLLGVHEAFCDVAMRNASLPGSCTVSFLFARSHAHFISLVLSYVRGQDQPYTLLRQRPISLPVLFTVPLPLRVISLLFPTQPFSSLLPSRKGSEFACARYSAVYITLTYLYVHFSKNKFHYYQKINWIL